MQAKLTEETSFPITKPSSFKGTATEWDVLIAFDNSCFQCSYEAYMYWLYIMRVEGCWGCCVGHAAIPVGGRCEVIMT